MLENILLPLNLFKGSNLLVLSIVPVDFDIHFDKFYKNWPIKCICFQTVLAKTLNQPKFPPIVSVVS